MERFSPYPTTSGEESGIEPVRAYRALDGKKEKDLLAAFTPEQQREIRQKQQVLSSLAYFIGKDFRIPVELNEPGAGWHWNFQENVIRIDPKDLLEKPMDYLRFVISHEGGHRRISRTDFIPLEEWGQPGFSFMMNAIEDPRDNNFVAESYPKFKEQMGLAYKEDLDFEAKAKEKADQKLGYRPRFMQAGFEYIKQWFREVEGKDVELSEDLPEEVKAVVTATLSSARDSWLRYPSRQEADKSEDLIRKYAQVSYEINRDEVWPEFKKLIDDDMEDQKMQELLKDAQKNQASDESGGQGLPQELKDKLTPEEQQSLQEAIKQAIEDAKKEKDKAEAQGDELERAEGKPEVDSSQGSQSGKPVDISSLPAELKQKIKEYIESLPEEEQRENARKAQAAFKEFEDALNEELQGKLSDNPEKKAGREEIEAEAAKQPEIKGKGWEEKEKEREEEARESRKRIESLFEAGEKDPYHEALEKVSDLIDALTADLRDIFVKRKIEKHEVGYRSGLRWNIRQRIREKVAGVPLFKTEAREQRESESEEMDYAVTLLVDLSGSMRSNGKIQEAFKSSVVLAETLNNLGIQFEIVGFQDILLEFKSFEEHLGEPMRRKLNQMILEVYGTNPEGHNNPGDNDDGVALREASQHLAGRIAKNKFLIAISDGIPETSYKDREQLDRELHEAVAEITANTNQKLIGLGLNSKTVATYYENNISGITTEEMVETLGELLREVIEKY
ncbi:MAG: Response regulator receiver protein [Parcubacteria group bacterium GW2011_GWA1_47_8]|nr:hypothetical protein [uncultured bacterium]KKU81467.1 MAG: Response regulator receiver protein [Parcubacteria group bacterium GW2011_GWA1_47_8]